MGTCPDQQIHEALNSFWSKSRGFHVLLWAHIVWRALSWGIRGNRFSCPFGNWGNWLLSQITGITEEFFISWVYWWSISHAWAMHIYLISEWTVHSWMYNVKSNCGLLQTGSTWIMIDYCFLTSQLVWLLSLSLSVTSTLTVTPTASQLTDLALMDIPFLPSWLDWGSWSTANQPGWSNLS